MQSETNKMSDEKWNEPDFCLIRWQWMNDKTPSKKITDSHKFCIQINNAFNKSALFISCSSQRTFNRSGNAEAFQSRWTFSLENDIFHDSSLFFLVAQCTGGFI